MRTLAQTTLVAKIALFYEKVNREWHSLEEFKRRHGFCCRGISCLEPCLPETRNYRKPACAEHYEAGKDYDHARRTGKATARVLTKYAAIRNKTREQNKESKIKKSA